VRGHWRAVFVFLVAPTLLVTFMAASRAGVPPAAAAQVGAAQGGTSGDRWTPSATDDPADRGAPATATVEARRDRAVARASARPLITSLNPSAGKPGSKVTLRGKRFGAKRGIGYVKFGKLRCTRYVLWSGTKIICRVPASAAGSLSVQLKTAAGLSNRKSFRVTGAPTPIPSPTPLPGTLFQETDTHLRFLGAWTGLADTGCSGGTQKAVNSPGAVFVDFTGTQAHVIASKGPAYGIMKVTLDGVAQPAVDLYASAAKYQQSVFSKIGLADAAHRLVLEWTFTKNASATATTVNVDAVSVVGSLAQAPDLTDGLVGFWATTPEWTWVESYAFRADGTYTYLVQGLIGSTSGLLRQEGLYAAYQGQSSMLLLLFNRWERFTPSGGPDGSWYPIANGEWPYQIIPYSNGAKLNIANGWGADYWRQ